MDWLVLAQVAFLPRLWQLDKPEVVGEFISLLDYRAWKGRFGQLQAGEKLVAYPDSDHTILTDNVRLSLPSL